MSEPMDSSDALRAVLHEEALARAGAHPELERLADYLDGALDDEAEERLRDHLASCRACADRLLEMSPLMQPDERPEEGVAGLEIEAAWRRLRGRTEADRAVAVPSRGLRALAASLAVAALALGLWAGRLQQVNRELRSRVAEASARVANLPVLYLNGARRAVETESRTLEVPESAGSFALFFSITEARPATEYGVRFLDAAGGLGLDAGGLVVSESGGLRLGLPRGLLPAGEYRMELRARRDGDWKLEREYRLTIVYR